MKIAVRHHEACPVMTNGDSEGKKFFSYPHTIMDCRCSQSNTALLLLNKVANMWHDMMTYV